MNSRPMMRAAVAQFDFGSHGRQQVASGLNVAHLRNIFENDGFFSQQSRGHARQCRILSPADANRAQKRRSAADDKFIHK